MPSGSKKRKAAKKKKEKAHHHHHDHNHNNHDNTSLENDEPRSQDERDSDGGEVDSPGSMDHDGHTHPFNEGNGGSEKGEPSLDRPLTAENESMKEVSAKEEAAVKAGLKDDSTVKIDRELKSGEDIESKKASIEYVESSKESQNGNDRSSSLGNESQDYEEKLAEEALDSESGPTSYRDEAKPTDSSSEGVTKVIENATLIETEEKLLVVPGTVLDDVKSAVPVSEEAVEVVESASVETSVVYEVAGSVLKGNAEKLLPTTDEDIEILQAATKAISKENNENKVSVLSDEIVGPSSNVNGSATNETEGVELTLSDAPSGITDMAPKEDNKDKTLPVVDENVGVSLDLGGSAINGNESTALISEAPSAVTSRGTENIKGPVISESSENEPLVAIAPQVVRKTSWWNCCGLFD